jgi:hypothetical protein
MTGESNWPLLAAWTLGRVSDEDWADDLVRGGVPEDSPVIIMLRERNRPAEEDGEA